MSTTTHPEERDYRLPRTVVPRRYELRIEPDLDAATFGGSESVQLEVAEPVGEIVLNAAELDISSAWLESRDRRIEATVELDDERERAVLRLSGTAEPGEWTLHAEFRGVLNDKLKGFYRSTYTGDDGAEHVIGTTQFEATDARRAFPCWDEPDLKAVFGVTLVVAEGLMAISNGREVERTPAGDGRVAVRFADTIPMSTYLVAFVVGRLEATEAVEVDGVPLRVVHVPGKAHLTAFPLEVARFCLGWFARYYDIPYPGDKVDLVALPDFAAGAMENLGAITFREALLLVDPAEVTRAELERVADVVAHELAHMWFGDLVTMRWWNGLWLNEAFATFMELAAVDRFRPEWRRWVSFGLERGVALDVDSLESTRPIEYPVRSPDDAQGMFDVLTYQKGGSVLRMLEQYLGEDRFRDGIRHYLRSREYGNAETTDLWDAIEEATGEPVRRIMDSWIFQGGHPAVAVSRGANGAVTLSQRRFRFLPDPDGAAVRWSVPVIYRAGEQEGRVLLDGDTAEVDVGGADPVVVNAGGHGFYRVAYAPDLLASLSARALEVLEPVERHQLVEDVWASVLAGDAPAAAFVDLARGLDGETDRTVWTALVAGLGQLERVVDAGAKEAFHRFVAGVVRPAVERIGWVPHADEDDLTRQLRGTLVEALAIVGDDHEAQGRCRESLEAHLGRPGSVDPNVVAASVRVVAHAGGPEEHERFGALARESASPQEQLRYLYALAGFRQPGLAARTAAATLTADIRTQNAPFVLQLLLLNRNPEAGETAWRFVAEEWDRINERFPESMIPRLLGGITALSRPEIAADVEAFFREHEVPQGALQVAQHLERLRINVALREREAGRLGTALGG